MGRNEPRCLLFGENAVIQALESELKESKAAVGVHENVNASSVSDGEPADYVFISTSCGVDRIKDAVDRAKQRNGAVRIILIDPTGEFNIRANDLGAHSLIRLDTETAKTTAQYWLKANLLTRL